MTNQKFTLLQLMRSKGWTAAEVATRAGLPLDTVAQFVRGEKVPSAPDVAKLAKAFGVSTFNYAPWIKLTLLLRGRSPTSNLPALRWG
jgi:transcriptional regulator with XRE-family HTH domain